jgi:hypothetical protein
MLDRDFSVLTLNLLTMSTSSSVQFFTPSEFVAEFNIITLRTVVNTKTEKVSVLINENTEDKEFLPVSKQIQEDHNLLESPNLKFWVPVETDKRGKQVLDYQSACLIVCTPGDLSKFETKGISLGF